MSKPRIANKIPKQTHSTRLAFAELREIALNCEMLNYHAEVAVWRSSFNGEIRLKVHSGALVRTTLIEATPAEFPTYEQQALRSQPAAC